MNVFAILDSMPAARLVRRIIGDESFEVFNAGERSTAIMMACGALTRELTPTVLLLDADTLEHRMLTQSRLTVGGILDRCHGRTPYRLILAIPQVEAILFSDREGLENALGRAVADLDWFEARFRPRAVFRRLLGEGDFEEKALTVIDALDDVALRRMARHPVVREIRSFMTEVQEPAAKRARVRRAG
ncbi:MAG TPA: hypothetical protein VGO40_16935 [Longimicrobium sp.]|jgi:hypothetical protein|nr:hypothetical protein [Longimicrobium sp.]